MNPNIVLKQVEAVIIARSFSSSGRYVLYYKDGKVGIEPTPSTIERKYHIIRCDSTTLDRGFTSAEWNRIARKIAALKKPCPCQKGLYDTTTGKIEDPKKTPEKS